MKLTWLEIIVDDNREAGQGLQLCNQETGTYCCKRDYDCCTNSTLTYQLGPANPLTTISRPSSAAKTKAPATQQGVVTHPLSDSPKLEYARDTIIGAGAGFGVAALVFFSGGFFCMMRRRRQKRKNKERVAALTSDNASAAKLGAKEVSVSVSAIGDHSEPIELGPVPRYESGSGLPRGTNVMEEHVIRYEPEGSHSPPNRRPGG
jgi:hypothetical protein